MMPKQKGARKVSKAMMFYALDRDARVECPNTSPLGYCQVVECGDCKDVVRRAIIRLIKEA
jgi:hypothetical protein